MFSETNSSTVKRRHLVMVQLISIQFSEREALIYVTAQTGARVKLVMSHAYACTKIHHFTF